LPDGRVARGRFITLEGGEGAGKSTQAARLAVFLRETGGRAVATREPGGSPGAERIRGLLLSDGTWDPLAETLLLMAARAEHVSRTIEPALAQGVHVVCDRFADSTFAYQGRAGGLGEGRARALHDCAFQGLAPDLTLVLDLPVPLGLGRARARGEANRYEAREPAFHEAVRQAFLAIAAAEPGRCVVINASASEDGVTEAIIRAVAERLGL